MFQSTRGVPRFSLRAPRAARQKRRWLGLGLLAALGWALISISGEPQIAVAQTEILDRVAATIGGVPITQSDVVREYRLETFLATGRVPMASPDAATRKAVLARLIDQTVLASQLGNYMVDKDAVRAATAKRITGLKKACGSDSALDAALHQLGIGEAQLTAHLRKQEQISAMIEIRLRPVATVEPQQIEQYYTKSFVPAYRRARSIAPPPLAEVRERIRAVLVERKVNQLLDEWLVGLKRDAGVEILPED